MNENDNHKFIPFTERQLKELEEQTDGRGFAQIMQEHNYPVDKVGSHLKIDGEEKGRAYVPDSARAMAKPDRAMVIRALKAIIVIGGLIFVAVYFQAQIRDILAAGGWF